MTTPRRAIALCEPNTDIDELVERYHLEVVHNAYISGHSAHAPTIAALHIADHRADVVIAPDLTRAQVRESQRWQAITIAADIVTSDGLVEYAPLAP